MAFPGEPEEMQASLWLAMDRRRVRERFRSTLAGLLELEVLRAKHRMRVDRALGRERTTVDNAGEGEVTSENDPTGRYQYHVLGCTGSLRVMRSHTREAVSNSSGPREIWAWSSWYREDFLQPHHHQQCCRCMPPDAQLRANLAQTDSKSRASSGFCDDDFYADEDEEDTEGSSLSGSHSSLDGRPLLIQSREGAEGWGRDSPSTLTAGGAIPTSGFLSVASLCPESHWWHFSTVLQAQVSLDPKYCLDLMAGQSQEVYRFPSPLHAVALQSPLYASMQSPAPSPGGACHSKSCSLPMCLTAGPQQTGCSPTPHPERCSPEELILELACRHRRHGAVQRDTSSTSCLCPVCVSPSTSSGVCQWPSLCSPTQGGREGRGNIDNHPSSAPLGDSSTHEQPSSAQSPVVMDISEGEYCDGMKKRRSVEDLQKM